MANPMRNPGILPDAGNIPVVSGTGASNIVTGIV